MIIVLSDDDGVSRFGFELDERGTIEGPVALVAIEGDAKPTLTAFYYDLSLEELDLSIGVLGAVDDCLLAHPMFVAESDGGEWSEAADAISRLLDPIACRLSSDCATFFVSTIPLLTAATTRLSLPLDETRALVGVDGGLFFEATLTGASPADAFAGQPSSSGLIDRDGRLWLGGDRGRIAMGPPPFSEVSPTQPDESIAAFGESASGRMLAVGFVQSSSTARIYELAPQRHLIGTYQSRHSEAILIEIAWLSDRAIIVFGSEEAVVIDGDQMTETTPDAVHPAGTIYLHSVLASDGVAYVGASGGLVFYSSDLVTWFPIGGEPLGTVIEAIYPFGRGVLFASEDGLIGQYASLRAPCRAEGVAGIETHQIIKLGSKFMLSGSPRQNPTNTLYFLEPR